MRAFPVVYATDVQHTASFWERLGFVRRYEFPDDEPGYVALRRDDWDIAVTTVQWPADRYGLEPGEGPRYEMFVYVDDVDELVSALRDEGVTVLRDAEDMPWGERVATIADPDGNPVALAGEPQPQPSG